MHRGPQLVPRSVGLTATRPHETPTMDEAKYWHAREQAQPGDVHHHSAEIPI